MKTSSKMLFISLMVISTLMVISSSSWINMWIGMEINLMSFIPMIPLPKNMYLSQSAMTYFLVQSMASMMFMVFILMNKYIFSFMNENMCMLLLMMTMMMKMGMPPFHMWFPEMVFKMKWLTCFMLMTWQKIAPMYVSMMVTKMNTTIVSIICVSSLMGAIGGINQTSMQKIMAYSSINHMSWMMMCALSFKKSWMTYITLYTAMMMLLCVYMHMYNIMYINQMNIFSMTNMEKMIIVSLMMSMGGIPPFLGFLPKWITIQYMISSSEFVMMVVMMMSSLVTLSYYLRMTTSLNMILSQSQKWMYVMRIKKSTLNIIFLVNFMLPMLLFMINLY